MHGTSALTPQGVVLVNDLWIRANGQPIPQGSKVAGKTASGRLFLRDANPGLKAWRENVAQATWRIMNEREFIIDPITGPVQLHVWFYFDKPKSNRSQRPTSKLVGDLDKHLRSICDALTDGGAYDDDSQVVSISGEKLWADENTRAGAVIHVSTIK